VENSKEKANTQSGAFGSFTGQGRQTQCSMLPRQPALEKPKCQEELNIFR
jgi:hypothetical protein